MDLSFYLNIVLLLFIHCLTTERLHCYLHLRWNVCKFLHSKNAAWWSDLRSIKTLIKICRFRKDYEDHFCRMSSCGCMIFTCSSGHRCILQLIFFLIFKSLSCFTNPIILIFSLNNISHWRFCFPDQNSLNIIDWSYPKVRIVSADRYWLVIPKIFPSRCDRDSLRFPPRRVFVSIGFSFRKSRTLLGSEIPLKDRHSSSRWRLLYLTFAILFIAR